MPALLALAGLAFYFSSSCEQQPIRTDIRNGWAGLSTNWVMGIKDKSFYCHCCSAVLILAILLAGHSNCKCKLWYCVRSMALCLLSSPMAQSHPRNIQSVLFFEREEKSRFLRVCYIADNDQSHHQVWKRTIDNTAKLAHPVLQVMFYRFKKCG